jgi:hypothetical protein
MTLEDLADLNTEHPAEMGVWYNNMLQMDPAKLVETILFHMPKPILEISLESIALAEEGEGSED